MKKNDWKERLNIVYSTKPDFEYTREKETEQDTLPNEKQNLRVSTDKKNRGGKIVTLVTGFEGAEENLKALGKLLKTQCGVGGSVKEGEIIIQGDFKTRIAEILKSKGYHKTKVI